MSLGLSARLSLAEVLFQRFGQDPEPTTFDAQLLRSSGEFTEECADPALAAAHDRQWMQRKRILDSLIVVLFVFRLVLSRGDKGYATVLAELWDQCRKLGIALPQREPVAASSICKARARVPDYSGIRA